MMFPHMIVTVFTKPWYAPFTRELKPCALTFFRARPVHKRGCHCELPSAPAPLTRGWLCPCTVLLANDKSLSEQCQGHEELCISALWLSGLRRLLVSCPL